MPRSPKYIAATADCLAPGPAHLHIGTSGWAYPTWKSGFYPPHVPAKAFLHVYAAQLTAVEVNYTFRLRLKPEQLAEWLQATPPGFHFSFKAPQRITHFKRLHDCADEVHRFMASLAPAQEAGKLGPVLFQLPPNFKAAPDRLRSFLCCPALTGMAVVFEFRHPSWDTSEVLDILQEAGAARGLAETNSVPDLTSTAPFRFYRLRRDGGYTLDELDHFAMKLRQIGTKTYVFFRHQDEPTGAMNGLALLRSLRGAT